MASIITIRAQKPPDDATVVVQLGRGDHRGNAQMLNNVRRAHDHWRGVFDARGRFAISAYVLDGLDESLLLSEIPNDSFGRSTVGELTGAEFELLPTTIKIPPSLPAYSFQPWHLSVMLGIRGLLVNADLGAAEWLAVEADVKTDLERLLRMFEPRLANPYRR
jgi:hypothetical protein